MISDELKSAGSVLVEWYNAITYEWGANDYHEGQLKKTIGGLDIGELSFDEDRIASLTYRNYTTRADV